MDKRLKILLSVIFVLTVAFLVARAFWPQPSPARKQPAGIVVKKKKPASPLKKTLAVPWMAQQPKQAAAEMAIILDDWGMNAALVNEAVAVGRPLTLSVLPSLPHSRDIAERAHAAGLGVMLHMPMQAKNPKAPREPRTILTTSSDKEILMYLDAALESVPYVEGVNNHQGSAATSDLRVMRTVLSHLKQKGLFFVDSQVISTSVGRKAAGEIGIPFARRQIFLDNTATVEAVKKKLDDAVSVALQRGKVIAIGHDKKSTLAALREKVPEIEKRGVKLVLAKEMVEPVS